MKSPRFRITTIMLVVAMAALDFGAIRAMPEIGPPTSELLVLGALPMTNVLAVGLLIGHRRPGTRPFLMGFEAFGVMALALYVALVSFSPQTVLIPYLEPLFQPIRITIGPGRPVVLIATLCSVGVVMLGWPQVALALIGGSLSRRFRVTTTRR